jgi:hypothetical protein
MWILNNLTRRKVEGSPEQARDTARYLTDGVRLFRRIGKECIAGVVWLENCWSLEIMVATIDDLRCLRPVFSHDDDAVAAEILDSHAAHRRQCAGAGRTGGSLR